MDVAEGRSDGAERVLFTALRAGRPWTVDLVIVTGDILDSADVEDESALRAVRSWRLQLTEALGKEIPLILVPGNHDRRKSGVFGPQHEQIFRTLKTGLADLNVWVSGCALPQLAEKLPAGLTSALPFDLCTYDSTFLGMGKMSAGGTLRAEDLLQMATWLTPTQTPGNERPLVLLMHHHLIPTPVTDTTTAGSAGGSPYLQLLLHSIAPRIIAHADREELFMTALGAGSALSLLHSMQRPVLILHGHKHCPAVRLLRSAEEGSGDLLLVGAGSAGLAERWSTEGADEDRPMMLWPSYNLITYSPGTVEIETVAFDPDEEKTQATGEISIVKRPLVIAKQHQTQWRLTRLAGRQASLDGPLWAMTRAHYKLQSSVNSHERWDLECEQEVRPQPESLAPRAYGEPIVLLRDAVLLRGDGKTDPVVTMPGRAAWKIQGGLCRSAKEARRSVGPEEAFAHIGLINRHTSLEAELSLTAPDGLELAPFGSAMDLTTGQLRPMPLTRDGQRWTLRYPLCPARTLLRIHWPLLETANRT